MTASLERAHAYFPNVLEDERYGSRFTCGKGNAFAFLGRLLPLSV
jgi:hypothetical protein